MPKYYRINSTVKATELYGYNYGDVGVMRATSCIGHIGISVPGKQSTNVYDQVYYDPRDLTEVTEAEYNCANKIIVIGTKYRLKRRIDSRSGGETGSIVYTMSACAEDLWIVQCCTKQGNHYNSTCTSTDLEPVQEVSEDVDYRLKIGDIVRYGLGCYKIYPGVEGHVRLVYLGSTPAPAIGKHSLASLCRDTNCQLVTDKSYLPYLEAQAKKWEDAQKVAAHDGVDPEQIFDRFERTGRYRPSVQELEANEVLNMKIAARLTTKQASKLREPDKYVGPLARRRRISFLELLLEKNIQQPLTTNETNEVIYRTSTRTTHRRSEQSDSRT